MINFFKKIVLSKLFLIILLILLIIVCVFIAFCLIISSSFRIKGDEKVDVDFNTQYIDKGATNKFNFKINIDSNVDTTKVGQYKVKYTINILFLKLYKIRTVNVVDKEKPKITLNGDEIKNICPGSIYEEDGFTAVDNYDGDITEKVKRIDTEDGITYEISDSSNNTNSVFRQIKKEDKESPNISLIGNDKVYIKIGIKYTDQGYNVSDNCDKNVSVESYTDLNTNVKGNYIYKYTAKDSSGNESEVTRQIVVYEEGGSGIIYLTFDDGPSGTGSTRKILDILKEENVKATFFVTGVGNYDLLREEYNDGHAIALHTNTHEYSYVYSSVDNYFNDLYAVENKVYNAIGIKPKIIRFPGGSNNTVSNRYCQGIMNILVKEVVNRGYNYFDWNVSSGDAGGCTTSSCVYNTTINGLSKSKNNVVLMHDIKMFTANALKDIIQYAKANGYTFKVIDDSTPPVRFKW